MIENRCRLDFFAKKLLLLAFIVCCLTAAGCAPKLAVKRIAPDRPIDITDDRSLVFGKISYIEDGKEKSLPGRTLPLIIHAESGKKLSWWYRVIEKDGNFYWTVPKGTYLFSEIPYRAYFINTQAAFQVPSGAEAFYIGNLKIDVLTKGKGLFGRHIENVSISVIDEFEAANELFMARHPDFSGKAEKSLMVHDKSIPADRKALYRRNLAYILNAIGMGLVRFP